LLSDGWFAYYTSCVLRESVQYGTHLQSAVVMLCRHVLINESKNKKSAKYTASGVPHGFGGSASVYEASIRNPLGPEWQTAAAHKAKTQPAILVRAVWPLLYFQRDSVTAFVASLWRACRCVTSSERGMVGYGMMCQRGL
jgi:hypothetical protein